MDKSKVCVKRLGAPEKNTSVMLGFFLYRPKAELQIISIILTVKVLLFQIVATLIYKKISIRQAHLIYKAQIAKRTH